MKLKQSHITIAIFFIVTLCCLPLPSTYAVPLDRPSPNVKYDKLPKWFRDEMKTNKYLSRRELPFMSVLETAIITWMDACHWKQEDKDFLFSAETTQEQKFERYKKLDDCDHKGNLYNLFAARSGDISHAGTILLKMYTYRSYINLNQALRAEKAGVELPWALALYDSIQRRRAFRGTIFRGGFCNVKVLQEKIGQGIDVDQFTSFSENRGIANFFLNKAHNETKFLKAHNETPWGDLCMTSMSLADDDRCGFSIKDISEYPHEEEVLIPFGTKVKLLSMVMVKKNEKLPSYYHLNWECDTKAVSSRSGLKNAVKSTKLSKLITFSFPKRIKIAKSALVQTKTRRK